ncbi:MAG: aldo/keto reductase [Nitrospinae bacterium]|jgi:aryl-alcohol dehydrogenase-like predicted oxidoreductase|nr:aldo/keto reductase [Nitrospinota bacterium]MDA1110296.1 aldo/keto reductase [Nitrospinota bacterium]
MKYRNFSGQGTPVSEVGLGTWQLGADWGNLDDKTAKCILNEAVDSGVTFLDTADVYGKGLSETRIGRFIKAHNGKIFIATKLGRFPEPGGIENFSLKQFRQHTENSLRRLGVEALDLTQVHCLPTEVLQQGDLFEWLRILKQEGKIKHFGLSVESMEEALICLDQEGVSSLQIIFNIFRQKPITALFDQAQAKDVSLIIRLPLASGLLSGKFKTGTTFPENDHRNYNSNGEQFNVGETFAGIPFAQGVELADELKSQVPEGMTLAQMALRWVLDFDAVTVMIPGATTPEQVRANGSVSDLAPLPKELHRKLKEFYETRSAPLIRGKY